MNAGPIVPGPDGVRLPYGVRRADTPHACRGGRPYPKEMRELVIEEWRNGGIEALETPRYNALRE